MTLQDEAPPANISRSLRAHLLSASPLSARWGLLLTTIVTAAALLATAVAGYLHARSTAAALTRSLAIGMCFSAKQAIAAAGGTDDDALESVLAAMEPHGVRYIAITAQEGDGPRASAGMTSPGAMLATVRLPEGPVLALSRDGRMVRLVAPLAEFGAQDGGLPWAKVPRDRLVLEYESVTASETVSRALVTLTLSATAALVLLAAAAFFWRVSRRAERAAVQAERDRQLKALGEMSALLGHELRNPLAALKGHAQLLLEKMSSEHLGRRGAETIVREAVRLEDLANTVLEFARSGKVDRESADPVALVQAAIDATGQPVTLAIEGAIPAWQLDRVRMEEVLVNLLRNARQASPVGGEVELAVAAAGGQELVFEVRDHGNGVEAGDEDRIFEPFFTRRARGTGLGLTLARQIVEGHGGRISAANHPHGGAVFRVTIPRVGSPAPFSNGG